MSSSGTFRRTPIASVVLLISVLPLCLGQACAGILGPAGEDGHIYGDASAGDLTLASDSFLSAVAPTGNLQFDNLTIAAGVTLTVPSGTTFRCAGTFTNNGTLLVSTGTPAPLSQGSGHPGASWAPAEPGKSGSFFIIAPATQVISIAHGGNGGQGLTAEQALVFLDTPRAAGGAGATALATFSTTAPPAPGGNGGGSLLVLAQGAITNTWTIQADGANATTAGGGGGGAGGVIILASPGSIANSGTIRARGGNGGNAATFLRPPSPASPGGSQGPFIGAGGGGSGGLVRLLSPNVTAGTVDVSGGLGGAGLAAEQSEELLGGAGGGGFGGNGGSGGNVDPSPTTSTAQPGNPGDPGQVISTLTDPTGLF